METYAEGAHERLYYQLERKATAYTFSVLVLQYDIIQTMRFSALWLEI